MSKQGILSSALTFAFLLWLGIKAILKGIHFGETWRILATIICLAILSALIIENIKRNENSNN
jgi:hypothetical protein